MIKYLRHTSNLLKIVALFLTFFALMTISIYAAETSEMNGEESSTKQKEKNEDFIDDISSYSNILASLGIVLTLVTFFHKDHKSIKFRSDSSEDGNVSVLSFWNSSTQTIYWDDIYKGQLELKTTMPVTLKQIYMNDVTTLQIDNEGPSTHFNITFDMLLPKKGAVFVLEGQKNNKDNIITFTGRLKGENFYSVSYYSNIKYYVSLKGLYIIFIIVSIVVSCIFIATGVVFNYFVVKWWNLLPHPWLLFTIITVFIVIYIWIIWLSLNEIGIVPCNILRKINRFKSMQNLKFRRDGNIIKTYADENCDELRVRDTLREKLKSKVPNDSKR